MCACVCKSVVNLWLLRLDIDEPHDGIYNSAHKKCNCLFQSLKCFTDQQKPEIVKLPNCPLPASAPQVHEIFIETEIDVHRSSEIWISLAFDVIDAQGQRPERKRMFQIETDANRLDQFFLFHLGKRFETNSNSCNKLRPLSIQIDCDWF